MKTVACVAVALLAMLPGAGVAQNAANDTGAEQTSSFAGFAPTAVVGSGSFVGTESLMNPRFFRSGTPGDACSTFSSGDFQYIEVPMTVESGGSITATFDPATCGTGVFVTFHTAPFNPASICDNYIWSFGSSAAFTETFAAPAGADVVMIVSGVANTPGVVCGPFTYDIQGASVGPALPPPVPQPDVIPALDNTGLIALLAGVSLLGTILLMRRR